jgi:branched-chain amino acid transport system ATP-binding protein
MNLGAYRDKFVRELSTGTRRIVDLAMAIAHDPKVLLLDEPSSGIAQREAEALGPLLLRIRSETGCALLVIEHDMPLIKAVSNRIVALELGHPIAEGSPEEVVRDPRVVASYLGGDMAVINRSGKTKAKAGA